MQNSILIMWVVHFKALERHLRNDYCIHLKSSTDYVEAPQEQVFSAALQVKSPNMKWFCFRLFFL